MKSKSVKCFFGCIILLIVFALVASRITYITNFATTRVNNADNVANLDATIVLKDTQQNEYTKDISIKPAIVQNNSYSVDGIDIVKKAAENLGCEYDSTQSSDQPHNGKVDCSGLISVTLNGLGISTSGFYERVNNLPRSVRNWIQYGEDDFFKEVGVYYLDTSSSPYSIKFSQPCENDDSVETHATQLKVNYNGNSDLINILKRNDPINNKLRWYQYYSENGEIKTLPTGTIVCSYAGEATGHQSGESHMWIAIGDLGTSDASEARSILREMGILNSDDTTYDNLVYSENSTSTYWRIESSNKSINGVQINGVQINNGDPDLGTINGGKVAGSIWAYQIANDIQKPEGKYTLNVVKRKASEFSGKTEEEVKTELADKTKALAGAKFKLTQQIKTTEGLSNATEKTLTTENGKATESGYGEVTIYEAGVGDNNQDIYTIEETEAPNGYTPVDLTDLRINVYKKKEDKSLKIDHITITDASGNVKKSIALGEKGVIDLDEDTKYDFGIELDESGNVFTIIAIDKENPTDIDIHKGVKTVENQDSGYYSDTGMMFEINDETEYEDETTGKKYTEIELEQMYHEWVVETTIPEDVNNYEEYAVTDCIDTTKLDFSGIERVKVELINSNGTATTLEKDTDYKVDYDVTTHTLTVTYIDAEGFKGAFLSDATTSDKVRITFNTLFKVNNETGKLVVLEDVIQNAENQAVLHYNNGTGEKTKNSEKPEVHTGAVSVFKYEDTNGNKKHDEDEKALVGAEFKIALTEADAKEGKFIKVNGRELTAVSNEHGIATFVGLEFGGDAKVNGKLVESGITGVNVYKYDWEKMSKDYYIVETKTPEGYEKLEDVIKVTVSKNSSQIIDLTDKINEMEPVGNKPLKFDLALRKWVTTVYVTENGQTVEYKTGHKAEDNPEEVVKVDLKKSKVNDVTVKFKYSIRVTNEGEIAGEAREITDYIPQGLKFVKEDNPDWTTTDDERIVKTRKLEGVTLNPKENSEVEIVLTWVNGEDTMGVMTNTAEISEDYNEHHVHDIDSTPNNKAPKEDDIDIAEVMLTVKTGSEIIAYSSMCIGFITIVLLGVIQIRRSFSKM